MIDIGIPCNLTILDRYNSANFSREYVTLIDKKWAYLFRWSIITQIALWPSLIFDSPTTKSIVIFSHSTKESLLVAVLWQDGCVPPWPSDKLGIGSHKKPCGSSASATKSVYLNLRTFLQLQDVLSIMYCELYKRFVVDLFKYLRPLRIKWSFIMSWEASKPALDSLLFYMICIVW